MTEAEQSHLDPFTIGSFRASAARMCWKVLSTLIYNRRGKRSLMVKFDNDRYRFGPRPFDFELCGRSSLVGAEVGVLYGDHAFSLLSRLSIQTLYLVDSYRAYADFDQSTMDYARQCCRRRLKRFPQAAFLYATSAEAASLVPALDFVYLDGAHDYRSVCEDIGAWWPTLKAGGILGGHDLANTVPAHTNGVIHAVSQFAFARNLDVHSQAPDWWIKKPI